MKSNIETKIKKISADILKDYGQGRTIDKMNAFTSPDMDVVVDILDKLQKILFPGYYRNKNFHFYTAENNLQTLVEDGTYAEIAAKYPGIVNNLLFLNAK